jgi:CBS domain-containing protein
MRRVNIRAAFVGEPSYDSDSRSAEDGDEAVSLVVRGGELTAVVPQDTADGDVLEAATILRGTLHLENERVLTFEIVDGASGAYFEHEAADLYSRRQESGTVGLFSGPASPSQRASRPVLARNLMRTTLVTIGPQATVEEAARLIAFHQISGVLVLDGDRLAGVVSEADVIGKQGRTVADIMTPDVIGVAEDMPAGDIARLLTERRIRRVPVMRDGRAIGIITRGDIVRWVAH